MNRYLITIPNFNGMTRILRYWVRDWRNVPLTFSITIDTTDSINENKDKDFGEKNGNQRRFEACGID
jgi:hypothetical protein